MKKSLVAAAVSAAVMMPVGAQADMTVYGRINNAIVLEDKGGMNDSTADIQGVGSRFGVKASSDLGNGLTAHGRYEFGTNTDDGADGITSTRIATAGISGGFGRVDVGNQWTAFYNTVGVDIDPTWTIGPIGGTPYRSPNTIKYSNSVGPWPWRRICVSVMRAMKGINCPAMVAASASGLPQPRMSRLQSLLMWMIKPIL